MESADRKLEFRESALGIGFGEHLIMENMFEKVLEAQKGHKGSALVTVIKTEGSTPRKVGSKMIVFDDGEIIGSVGGASVEALVVEKAKECIKSRKCAVDSHSLNDPGNEDTGMICDGMMEFFIEPITIQNRLFIFGAGHVGLALARLAYQVGFEYTVIDDREEFANRERFPDALEIVVDNMGEYADGLECHPTDFIAIMTRGHSNDYEVIRGVIQKPYRYLGMIGSISKRNETYSRLRKTGVSDDLIKQVYSPIGLKIHGETPEEIAVSIVAEMIKVRSEK
jgi:xanthine dehydrogenase accessory factor